MPLPVALGALVVGLVILVRAADVVVAGASTIAVRRAWSPTVIGALVIGFGTSLPELVISVTATLDGAADLAIGNAAGSNVANLLLVLGIAALVAPFAAPAHEAPRRDATIAALAAIGLLVAAAPGRIGGVAGGMLVLGIVAAGIWQLRSGGDHVVPDQIPVDRSRVPASVRVVGGLVGTVVGAQVLVTGAVDLADRIGVPELVVGSVLVAAGTSLPELATAIAASRRGEVGLLLGNLLGSNAFNALMVVGASALAAAATGGVLVVDRLAFAVVVAATVVTLGAAAVLARRPAVGRPGGAVLVALYLVAVPLLVRAG